ncbi:Protein CBG17477 [Caenorhabditis briggsae]|uniref:Serpentine receptor class gamma n=1 Tax=Caenorhabditis briggsae TaxID=6238 RepID=A8XR39_CAEBR|nr:Protein CBG17477 [Caenorhabditis briggsae]CAP35112.1 Protein CBG17477 [Caenorhabditis briggsae]
MPGLFGTTAWQLSYMQISMGITLITNLITSYHHIQNGNPGILCKTWCLISGAYLFFGSIFCFFHMKSFDFEYQNIVFITVFFIWDGFNILNPLIMIVMYRQLRKQVFWRNEDDEEHVIVIRRI